MTVRDVQFLEENQKAELRETKAVDKVQVHFQDFKWDAPIGAHLTGHKHMQRAAAARAEVHYEFVGRV